MIIHTTKHLIVNTLIKNDKASPNLNTQKKLMEITNKSQVTIAKYLAELKGEGIVIEVPIGTSVIYNVSSLDELALRSYISLIYQSKPNEYYNVRFFSSGDGFIVEMTLGEKISYWMWMSEEVMETTITDLKSLFAHGIKDIDGVKSTIKNMKQAIESKEAISI